MIGQYKPGHNEFNSRDSNALSQFRACDSLISVGKLGVLQHLTVLPHNFHHLHTRTKANIYIVQPGEMEIWVWRERRQK